MGLAQVLNDIYSSELVPPDAERDAVRKALNSVEQAMGKSPPFSIAERHPCGSFAKETMLKGRQEAELVAVLAQAPTSATLDELQKLLAAIPGVGKAEVIWKCVAVTFPGGVKVDVLPVVKAGLTAEGPDIPDKLRHANDGPKHVAWFKERSSKQPALQQVVRLLKGFKRQRGLQRPISFALEVLAEEALRTPQVSGLDAAFRAVMVQLANGRLDRPVIDPAKSDNDLVGNMDPAGRQRVADEARQALASMDAGRRPF